MTFKDPTTLADKQPEPKNLANWLLDLMAKSLKSGDSMLLHREENDRSVDITRVGVLHDEAELSLN